MPPEGRAPQLLAAEREEVLARFDVSRETAERLDVFVDLLLLWQKRINLIAESTVPSIWTRHIADSLDLCALAGRRSPWLDLGSGGGFPGIVKAIASPDTSVELVESNGKKAAFLRTVIRELGLDAAVHAQRIEDSGTLLAAASAVSARALAPLETLLSLVWRDLSPGAVCYFMKGREHEREIAEASAHWRFTMVKHSASFGAGSVILEIRDIERRGA